MSNITATFSALRQRGQAALMPYITVGHPSIELTETVIRTLVQNGADIIELGIPYSDPLADGPTIQKAGQVALAAGTTIAQIHAMVRRLRDEGISTPMVYMVYYNCVFRQGEARFINDAYEAGIDGLIIPDLPLEQSASMRELAQAKGIELIYLLAPTSTAERIAAISTHARGFIYCVSVTGVTGARDNVSAQLAPFLQRIRQHTAVPLAVGFGVATAAHAAHVASLAEGVIVGSALVNRIEEAGGDEAKIVEAVSAYMQSLHGGVKSAAKDVS